MLSRGPGDELEFDYANAIATKAEKAMAQFVVPPTPSNFAVWFNYMLGKSASLRNAIDAAIASRRKFDSVLNFELFSQHVLREDAADGAVSDGVPEQLQGVVGAAKQLLARAIADNRTQIESLGGVTSLVEANADPSLIINTLVSELSKASERAMTLEQNFENTSQELEKIRTSLQEAEYRSKVDALTGLANRGALDQFLRAAQIDAANTGQALSVLLMDVDHFKKFNDTYGHQTGDQVLRLVSKILQGNLRENCLGARYGGEELMAVLPGAKLDICREVAERIRWGIAARRIRRRTTGEEISSITVSIGVAQLRAGDTVEALIERCDKALYQAKREGRNQTVTEAEMKAEPVAA